MIVKEAGGYEEKRAQKQNEEQAGGPQTSEAESTEQHGLLKRPQGQETEDGDAEYTVKNNYSPQEQALLESLQPEAHLSHLFSAELITPNELHYVRNHGKMVSLLMDDLKLNYLAVNIPVVLVSDGNRRKELNMIHKSKGFNWGAGAISCAYRKGPLLRNILISTGIPEKLSPNDNMVRYWVNFAGGDELKDGSYETCIPFEYAMDRTNDVLLAYKMNDVFPPDHGYLLRIWIMDRENSSYYHIWDNRAIPSFVKGKDDKFTKTMFSHPDTLSNKQILNSVIARPADGYSTFNLLMKTYFPDSDQSGGAMSNILDYIPLGEEVEMCGLTDEIMYEGHGLFTIEGRERCSTRVSLVLGGIGVVPGFVLIACIMFTDGDVTQLQALDANKAEEDILLWDELDTFVRDSMTLEWQQINVIYVLSHASKGWKGRCGHVDAGLIRGI
ncbi:hypothetical protein Dda_9480 [Drechslerella dactyloides]|uniref:Uncharacterized protein n=1 Tax=Drechslerella dactyloides TaxID=74499 RepID=A0AAD6IQ79_DREDA|nr:hypothetical protein Dda_9480 [Drechslerella dactyloides]